MLRFFPFTKSSDHSVDPQTSLDNQQNEGITDLDRGDLRSLDTSLPGEEGPDTVNSCRCCGTLIKFPDSVHKYKCSICQSTIIVQEQQQKDTGIESVLIENLNNGGYISHSLILEKVKECESNQGPGKQLRSYHTVYKPLEELICAKFANYEVLNNSFIHHNRTKSLRNLNIKEARDTFDSIASLPTTRPYYLLLLAANDMLRRPPSDLSNPDDLIWVMILFELPTLSGCLYHDRVLKCSPQTNPKLDTPEIKSISYEIIKRVIGYLANSDPSTVEQLARKLSSLSSENFGFKVQLLNLYITFHLTRLINKYYDGKSKKILENGSAVNQPSSPGYSEYNESAKLNPSTSSSNVKSPRPMSPSARRFMRLPISFQTGFISWAELNSQRSSSEPKPSEFKLRVAHYGSEWHIRTAARLLSVFYISNRNKLPHFAFYNALVDFISVRQDYEVWQSSFKRKDSNKLMYDILSAASTNIIDLSSQQPKRTPLFTFCNYPFLLTLGMKISILEYEAKKCMERKAEETFIKSLDKRKALDINLRIQVRRTHISNDSLRCLKQFSDGELKKSLKIEFIGEPGIDVGGLKKEWFGLVVKELFSPEIGLFSYDDESHVYWFTPEPLDLNLELFHMVGIVLGLAIYNSTILDLKFPLALYKKLINKKIRLDDYREMCPTTARGLSTLLEYSGNVENFELYFDTTFKNIFGDKVIRELIPNGSNIKVTNANKKEYVSKWCDFYMNSSIKEQFDSFYSGFHKVIGGNALSLFSAKEIEMIICGNDETNIDCESFKSITKYTGWLSTTDALESNVVKWFWKWFAQLNFEEQKKFLAFVTGSDRIPAIGVSTMSFKISRLRAFGNVKKLPIAHTCFNELCVFDYVSEEEFVRKLNMSIHESEGFGLR